MIYQHQLEGDTNTLFYQHQIKGDTNPLIYQHQLEGDINPLIYQHQIEGDTNPLIYHHQLEGAPTHWTSFIQVETNRAFKYSSSVSCILPQEGHRFTGASSNIVTNFHKGWFLSDGIRNNPRAIHPSNSYRSITKVLIQWHRLALKVANGKVFHQLQQFPQF